jgi:hypothetical protein
MMRLRVRGRCRSATLLPRTPSRSATAAAGSLFAVLSRRVIDQPGRALCRHDLCRFPRIHCAGRYNCFQSTWRNSRRRSAVVSLWVVNTCPIILLAKVNLIDQLKQLGPPVVIPAATVAEIQRRGPTDVADLALTQSPWLLTVDPPTVAPAVAACKLGACH